MTKEKILNEWWAKNVNTYGKCQWIFRCGEGEEIPLNEMVKYQFYEYVKSKYPNGDELTNEADRYKVTMYDGKEHIITVSKNKFNENQLMYKYGDDIIIDKQPFGFIISKPKFASKPKFDFNKVKKIHHLIGSFKGFEMNKPITSNYLKNVKNIHNNNFTLLNADTADEPYDGFIYTPKPWLEKTIYVIMYVTNGNVKNDNEMLAKINSAALAIDKLNIPDINKWVLTPFILAINTNAFAEASNLLTKNIDMGSINRFKSAKGKIIVRR